MNVLLGLLSLAALSLFLSWLLRRPAGLMPIVAVSACMLFFTVAGCLGAVVPGALFAGGVLWYVLCAAALVFTLIKLRGKIVSLFTPAFLCFLVGSVAFVLLFALTKPMLTQWDEFTFWGPAAKVTSTVNTLYTMADSSLIARSYPPGLIVFSYMMQFFGGFSEHGYIACFAILYLACFAAAASVWGKLKSATIVFFSALVCLPLLFEFNLGAGQMMRAYLSCLADMPMALLFGGALCFYFAGGEKGARLMLPFGLILGALTCVKDMGLALAFCALFIAALDMLACEGGRLGFYKLRRGAAFWANIGWGVLMIAGCYLLWWLHLSTAAEINRFQLDGSGQMDTVTMLLTGVTMLLGVDRSPQFEQVLSDMLRAFFTEPVGLLGPGMLVLCVILAVTLAAFLLSATKRQRKRVLVFTLAAAFCFVAFYIFNIFTYALIFNPGEAAMLREYNRYISPYWVGWLMGALVLLGRAATYHKASFYRLRLGRAVSAGVCLLLVAALALRGNGRANFLNVSPATYTERENLNAVAAAANAEGAAAEDRVYIISQGDNGTRFYMFGFQLRGVRTRLFTGIERDELGQVVYDEEGKALVSGNVAVTLVSYEKPAETYGPYDVPCNPEDLAIYLAQMGCTHVLVDVVDATILEDFAGMFSDGLAGWDGLLGRGNSYYKVTWEPNGSCLLVPSQTGGAA
ncbi:hypothetical protein LJC60_03615 [Ruminococcaceae bacterium OttesenSCG-928-D13]|nr:hypothetical protein [Ruminococcaceae bacterium OttesenSCG-928-D13]